MPAELIYPDGPDDHEGIKKYNTGVSQLGNPWHRIRERNAYRNILYYRGDQWITYDQSLNTWRPSGRLKSGALKPVTNKVAPLVNQGVSNLVSYKPPITYTPSTDNPDDVASAKVADQVNTVIEKEVNLRLLKPHIAKWVRLTGDVFLVNSYDTSPSTGTIFIQSEQCTSCQEVMTPLQIEQSQGKCPGCGSPDQTPQVDPTSGMPMPTGPRFQPAVQPPDGMNPGAPIGNEYPKGKHLTEIETVFSAWYDPLVSHIKDSAYFRVNHLHDKEWVIKTYGVDFADTVKYGLYGDVHSRYLTSLAYSTVSGAYALGSSGQESEHQCLVERLWIAPRQDRAPNGIYAVLVGGEVAEAQEYPYHDDQGRPFLNVVHIGEDQVPGQLAYKSRVDDLIPLQDLRNQVQSIMMLHSTRMANSVWLVTEGVGVSKISGQMGQILRYNALAGVPPPQRAAGDMLPPHFMTWLELIDHDMDAVYGIFEVGKGESPYKGAAYATSSCLTSASSRASPPSWRTGPWGSWSGQGSTSTSGGSLPMRAVPRRWASVSGPSPSSIKLLSRGVWIWTWTWDSPSRCPGWRSGRLSSRLYAWLL